MSNIETIIDFTYKGNRVILKTSKLDAYLHFLRIQTSGDDRWGAMHTREEWKKFVNWQCEEKSLHSLPIVPVVQAFSAIPPPYSNLKNMKKIIDVGSGLAQIDLVLSQFLPEIDFYLVDKNRIEYDPENFVYFHPPLDNKSSHGFYNSFDVIKDVVANSPVNPERIHFLHPENEWPDNVDVVMSYYSWNWHYHKSVYWDKLMQSLKLGGYFSTTLTLRKGETTVDEISQDLGSHPCYYQSIQVPANSPDRRLKGFDDIVHTGYYTWQRLK